LLKENCRRLLRARKGARSSSSDRISEQHHLCFYVYTVTLLSIDFRDGPYLLLDYVTCFRC